jgi:ATP-dependent helicase HrpA
VRAKERVTLYGLEIVSGRDISYGNIHPEEAHGLFVRSALVRGEVDDPSAFLKLNMGLIKRVRTMEEKLRRRDILVRDEVMAGFYSRRWPLFPTRKSWKDSRMSWKWGAGSLRQTINSCRGRIMTA